MLGVQEEDGSFSAHTLSNDHSAQNESEVARIRSEHPHSERKTVIRQVELLTDPLALPAIKQKQKTGYFELLPFAIFPSIRTGCSASSCRSAPSGTSSSSGVSNYRSACWSPDPTSCTRTSTPSSSPQTTTRRPT